jgi:site-specific DNA-methyltransferase (adenine-specific)
LVITSPPYNCNIPYRTYKDNLPWKDYLKWCENWIKQCYRILKDDGRIAINVLVEMGIENNTIRVSPMK